MTSITAGMSLITTLLLHVIAMVSGITALITVAIALMFPTIRVMSDMAAPISDVT